jgi:hypothetical protein
MQTCRHQTEYVHAETADGRILLIRRERAPRLTLPEEIFFHFCCAMTALLVPLLMSPFLPLLLFAGLWSAVPIILSYILTVARLWKDAAAWARSPPAETPVCDIVGTSVSRDELLSLLPVGAAGDASNRSLH